MYFLRWSYSEALLASLGSFAPSPPGNLHQPGDLPKELNNFRTDVVVKIRFLRTQSANCPDAWIVIAITK